MSLNLYDVNKSLLSATMLLVAASSLYAQNWQSKTIHDGKVSYFRYAEGASLNVRDCNFTKTKSGDIKSYWENVASSLENQEKSLRQLR